MNPRPSIHVADADTEQVLQDKMASLALDERERQTRAKAGALNMGYINLVGFPIGPEAISIIPEAQAQELQAICFLRTGNQIRIGVVDEQAPGIIELTKHLSEQFRAQTEVYLISPHSFQVAAKQYRRLPHTTPQLDELQIATSDLEKFQKELSDVRLLDEVLQRVSVTEAFMVLVAGALAAESSDIHVEAEADGVHIRYRIDGVLTPVATLPIDKWPRIIARIKLLAHLKLNITTVPQDGRITIFVPHEKIDIRVSTLPTAFGESVVMRLLRGNATNISFDQLGLRDKAAERLQEELRKPNGMIVITGPTGSGKTTSLYAALLQLNTPETKIITLEDPIEYKLEGINQSQVDWSKNYTFASGLRSILRQDPDIIMVGEIRDLETAETAVQAALTGHLVLSTIHTNDAAGAIPRFLSMGTKPYLLAPALNAVVAQRLVRKVCTACTMDDQLSAENEQRVRAALESIPKNAGVDRDFSHLTFRRGQGCDACHGTGFKGRIGVFEVLQVTPQVEQLILTGSVSEYQMRDVAAAQGMLTMVQDGILKALDGLTTIEEVFRVAA
jgi:type II secretory ATPase GspE/PulE/Tfp pilus assembly ATPase PilB-like protein